MTSSDSSGVPQVPPEILDIARQLRTAFGPGVKLLRAVDETTGAEHGRPIWDDPQAEWDQRRGKA
jgi:hypothetical protein